MSPRRCRAPGRSAVSRSRSISSGLLGWTSRACWLPAGLWLATAYDYCTCTRRLVNPYSVLVTRQPHRRASPSRIIRDSESPVASRNRIYDASCDRCIIASRQQSLWFSIYMAHARPTVLSHTPHRTLAGHRTKSISSSARREQPRHDAPLSLPMGTSPTEAHPARGARAAPERGASPSP